MIQDVFLKMCGLTSVWAEAQNEFAQKVMTSSVCRLDVASSSDVWFSTRSIGDV